MKINSIKPQLNKIRQLAKKYNVINIAQAKAEHGVTDMFSKVATKDGFQKGIGKFAKSNNTFAHLMVIESALLSGFYMFNTLRNKNIEKEQKPQMLINDTLVWGASTASTYLLENKISSWVSNQTTKYLGKENVQKFYQGLGEKAKEASKTELFQKVSEVSKDKLDDGLEVVSQTLGKHLGKALDKDKLDALKEGVKSTISTGINGSKDDLANALKDKVDDAYNLLGKKVTEIEKGNLKSGVNKLKTLVIFGLIYRFLGPVVMTPIANKLSAKLKARKQEKQQTQNPQTTEVKK